MRRTDALAPGLLRWYDTFGRHDLPWQHPRTAYRVWIAEVMLQQTQVATVIPYFVRFVQMYKSVPALAAADLDAVLAQWSGMGYYSRARNLHRAAQFCVLEHHGQLPRAFDALVALPGIGRSTAGAILAQAYGQRHAILDGNVKRVLARYHGVRGWPGSSRTQAQLWALAESHTPSARIADYTQAIMDLGATVCTRAKPRCDVCPLAATCIAHRDDLTAQLPARKPPRALPTRRSTFLLLRDAQGRLLLQRRPPNGIWAQLWSFPEASSAAAARRAFAHASAFRRVCKFTHTFSHFRLAATVLTAHLAQTTRVADNADARWLQPAQALRLGLPAPVRKLIEDLVEES